MKYVEEIGIVKKSTMIAEYDPSIHQYENVYSLDIQLKDTVYNIVCNKPKQIGDTMIFYTMSYE